MTKFVKLSKSFYLNVKSHLLFNKLLQLVLLLLEWQKSYSKPTLCVQTRGERDYTSPQNYLKVKGYAFIIML